MADQWPSDMDVNALLDLNHMCTSKVTKMFVKENQSFQGDAVEKWNGMSEEVIDSLFLRFIVIDEGVKIGCGSVLLDLLLKGGAMNSKDLCIVIMSLVTARQLKTLPYSPTANSFRTGLW